MYVLLQSGCAGWDYSLCSSGREGVGRCGREGGCWGLSSSDGEVPYSPQGKLSLENSFIDSLRLLNQNLLKWMRIYLLISLGLGLCWIKECFMWLTLANHTAWGLFCLQSVTVITINPGGRHSKSIFTICYHPVIRQNGNNVPKNVSLISYIPHCNGSVT